MAVVDVVGVTEINVALPMVVRRIRRRAIGLVVEADFAQALIRIGGGTMSKGIQFNHPGGDVLAFRIRCP